MNLNYKEFGQGPPIVIVHGLFGMLDNWQTIARQLSDHFTVYIIDQRNHGKSPHTIHINYDLMAEDLKRFMEDHFMFNAHIIGHSMGGKTAMQFALDYPDMVDRLVVVDIGTKAYTGGHQQIFEALFSLDIANIQNRSTVDAALKETIESFSIRQFLLKNLHRRKAGGYEWKMNLPVIYRDYEQILQSITHDEIFEKPALFIRGGRSDYVLDEDWAGIQDLFPDSELKTIHHAGHWVHAEAPEEFVDTVRQFLIQ